MDIFHANWGRGCYNKYINYITIQIVKIPRNLIYRWAHIAKTSYYMAEL